MTKPDKMFVSDFDGTLADDSSVVSEQTLSQLKRLGEMGVLRILATGRSLFSLKTVVDASFPIDYLVFSSGIGVYDWKNNILLQENLIEKEKTLEIYEYLIQNNYDFMVQLPVPHNHFFHHFSSDNPGSDFLSRINYYESHGVELIENCPETASQFVIICEEEANHLNKISNRFQCVKVIKATSPLDRKSVWIEILPHGISKASGIEFLQKKYEILLENIVTVGNDYYDLDMLTYSKHSNSYIVANAPKEIRSDFNIIESNLNNGVAKLLAKIY